jgi:hypothetical protein
MKEVVDLVAIIVCAGIVTVLFMLVLVMYKHERNNNAK